MGRVRVRRLEVCVPIVALAFAAFSGCEEDPKTPPQFLLYAADDVTYVVGVAIARNEPSHAGGSIESCAAAPALPEGLSLDPGTCALAGIPSVVAGPTTHVVTASNSGGSTTTRLTLTVVPDRLLGVSAISAGMEHTCAIVDGALYCWGVNGAGELGNGLFVNSPTPIPVAGLSSGVQSVDAGESGTCAIQDGALWCWGDNFAGQLANGTLVDSALPIPVGGLGAGVQAPESGWTQNCALVNGSVRCWGNPWTAPSVTTPVSGLESGVQALATGSTVGLCALVDGGVWCAGAMVSGLSSGVQAIAVGYGHACALKDGGVLCWGDNSFGQLGDDTTTDSAVPVPVNGLSSGVQAIAAGGTHSCAITNGAARCWGNNQSGRIGDGTFVDRHTPVAVTGLDGGVQAITAGWFHTCAIVNGEARCWGSSSNGQCGTGIGGASVPLPVLAPRP